LDQGLGGAFDRGHDSDIIIPLGQGDEKGPFFPLKQIDGSLFGGAVDSAIGHLVSPGESLYIESRQGEEGPPCKEIVLNIPYSSLRASFFMGGFNIARRRLKEIVGAEIEEARIEMDAAVEAV
jgi:hypothetical protein